MPNSATNQWINASGLAMLVVASLAAIALQLPPIFAALLCLLCYFAPVAVLETLLLKTHRRHSTGLDLSAPWLQRLNWRRVAVKLLGLAGTLAIVVAGHLVLRLYQFDDLQLAGVMTLGMLPLLLLVVPYFAWIDGLMTQPRDGYWHAGMLLMAQTRKLDRAALREHCLAWAIKGFFLPIMMVYLVRYLAFLQAQSEWLTLDHLHAVRWFAGYSIVLELSIVCVGYLCTVRLLDSHIRSSNPHLLAWLVTLACYEPFNRIVSGGVLKYDDGVEWHVWLSNAPWISVPWSIGIVACFAVWVWVTAAFGLRWSNLTNRGIITNGPYRYTKHPDYLAKSTFFWLIHMPFLSNAGTLDAVRNCALLVAINLIYYARAKTEERHLMADPAYVAYARAMEERSILRRAGRWLATPINQRASAADR